MKSMIYADSVGGQVLVLKREKEKIQAQNDEAAKLLEAVSPPWFVEPSVRQLLSLNICKSGCWLSLVLSILGQFPFSAAPSENSRSCETPRRAACHKTAA